MIVSLRITTKVATSKVMITRVGLAPASAGGSVIAVSDWSESVAVMATVLLLVCPRSSCRPAPVSELIGGEESPDPLGNGA